MPIKNMIQHRILNVFAEKISHISDEVLNLNEVRGMPSRQVATLLMKKVTPFAAGMSFLPGSSLFLTAFEMGLILQISRIYNLDPESFRWQQIVAQLGLRHGVSRGAQFAAEGMQVIPLIGSVAKGAVGAGTVFLLGHAIAEVFERRYPGRRHGVKDSLTPPAEEEEAAHAA